MKGAKVTVREISKSYGDIRAVDGVSIDVRQGEFISLLGPSGSGKTTLLMMIAGFETPNSGVIRVGDRDVTYLAPNRRDIGMVFQRYALFPHMTVAQNIGFPLRMRKIAKPEISRRVADVLSLVQLGGLETRLPSQLSGGQQQRVAVGRALVFEPPVLLMDEPLGALDKKLREQMQIEIKSLQQKLGVTVIYVTHDQEEALTMSDRIAVMRDGRLEQIGTPTALYDEPATPFVADFIGKTNFLEGECLSASPDRLIVRIGESGRINIPKASGSDNRNPGTRVRLAIRPEQIRIVGRGDGGDGALAGVVEAAIFVGAFRTFLLRLKSGDLIQVQTPADGAHVREGDAVDLVLKNHAVHVFPPMRAD
jgi:mannopine transport system ATP-binding protein